MTIHYKMLVPYQDRIAQDKTIYVSILPQTPLPSRLPHNIVQSSICYTVESFW